MGRPATVSQPAGCLGARDPLPKGRSWEPIPLPPPLRHRRGFRLPAGHRRGVCRPRCRSGFEDRCGENWCGTMTNRKATQWLTHSTIDRPPGVCSIWLELWGGGNEGEKVKSTNIFCCAKTVRKKIGQFLSTFLWVLKKYFPSFLRIPSVSYRFMRFLWLQFFRHLFSGGLHRKKDQFFEQAKKSIMVAFFPFQAFVRWKGFPLVSRFAHRKVTSSLHRHCIVISQLVIYRYTSLLLWYISN